MIQNEDKVLNYYFLVHFLEFYQRRKTNFYAQSNISD